MIHPLSCMGASRSVCFFLQAALTDREHLDKIFIDRDAALFAPFLQFYRTGKAVVSDEVDLSALSEEVSDSDDLLHFCLLT